MPTVIFDDNPFSTPYTGTRYDLPGSSTSGANGDQPFS